MKGDRIMQLSKIKWKPLIISLIITFAVGGLSSLLTNSSMEKYMEYERPPLSPPSAVFGIVWPILFLLMAISAYLVYTSDASDKDKKSGLFLYGLQLFINFFWTIIFFNLDSKVFAFFWLILLWLVVLFMIRDFFKVSKLAGWLQIPYLVWLTFAAYLNLGIILLNKGMG